MINIRVKSTNIELTQAISSYINEKVGSLEKLIDPNDTSVSAQVEVGKISKHHQSGDIFRAEINLHIAGANFRAVSKTGDLYAALDEVKDEMLQELRKHKNKKTDLARRGGARLKQFLRGIYRRNN